MHDDRPLPISAFLRKISTALAALGLEQPIDEQAAACASTPPDSPPAQRCGVHLELPYELASSHWAARRLPSGTRGTEFMTLCFLLLHARHLWGADLDLLCGLGFTTPDDAGRLYVRVSDLGLATETGLRRQTVAQSIQRLASRGLLDIHQLPAQFGGWNGLPFSDSRGTYMGTKLYLLSREVAGVFDLSRAVR